MSCRRFLPAILLASALPAAALAQSDEDAPERLHLELNTLQDTGEACRLTFLARNETGETIEKAVFETVIFDGAGGVVTLSLFDFRDLPSGRPRVRQFDLPNLSCATIGQALVNGASSCLVGGAESEVCDAALSLGSRLDVELLG